MFSYRNLQFKRYVPGAKNFVLVVVLSFLTINSLAPRLLNADTFLFPIMSIQHVTPFIWGQDRLVNLIPWIISKVESPTWNLFFHLFVFSASYFVLLALLSSIWVKRNGSLKNNYIPLFLTMSTVSLIVLQDKTLHSFVVEGQPYASSFVLLLIGFFTTTRGTRFIILGLLVSLVSLLLNPSGILVAFLVALIHFIHTRELKTGAIYITLASASFGLSFLISKLYGYDTGLTSYNSFDFSNLQSNIILASQNILAGIKYPKPILTLLLLSLIILSFGIGASRFKFRVTSSDLTSIGLATLFSATWVVVFACNKWVLLNGSHFRYFFPVYLLIIFIFSVVLYENAKSYNPNYLGVLALLLFIVLAARPLADPRTYSLKQSTKNIVQYMQRNEIDFVAGWYWDAWPVVYEDMKLNKSVIGFSYRAVGNVENARNEILSEPRGGELIRVVCVNSSVEACTQDVNSIAPFTYAPRDWSECGYQCSDILFARIK